MDTGSDQSSEPLVTALVQSNYILASKARRIVDSLLDGFLENGVALVFALLVMLILSLITSVVHARIGSVAEYVMICILLALGAFLYFYIGEKRWGRTLAKYLTATQVVSLDGTEPTSRQVVGRTFARLVPFDFLSVLIDENGVGWHDKWSHTRVVMTDSLPLEARPRHTLIPKIIIVVFVLVLPATLVGGQIYTASTGGQRFNLPVKLPSDLKLTGFQDIQYDANDDDYYSLTYTGTYRVIVINQLLAGFDFDPKQACLYMTPTPNSGLPLTPAIDPALHCAKIASGKVYDAWQVEDSSADPDVQASAPDYYLTYPPYRYVIKATSGSISRAEVKAMVDQDATYTASQLKQQVARNTAHRN